MRTLGIDYGERRVGLAISDRDGRVATPLETIERRDDRQVARVIAAISRREGVTRLVLGDPRSSRGQRGTASERVDRFANRLRREIELPLERVDETLTSIEARRQLREAGVSATDGRVDALAAKILLQEVLDQDLAGAEVGATTRKGPNDAPEVDS